MNTLEEKQQFRQGDILIELVAEIPKLARRQERSRQVTLAYGEMTGHRHVLETEDPADWWRLDPRDHDKAALGASEFFFSISAVGTVKHAEHAPIQLPPGHYRVTHQREYSPIAIRRVGD
jgi:hypothetical protein